MTLDINLSPLRFIIGDSENYEFRSDYIKKQEILNTFVNLIQEKVNQQLEEKIDIFKIENNALLLIEQKPELFISERVGDYDNLHFFRLFAIYVENRSELPSGIVDIESEDVENILLDAYDGEVKSKYKHIIDHSDCDGFYLPIKFDDPIWIEPSDISEGNLVTSSSISIGSSYKLLEELESINDYLKIDLKDVQNLEEFSEKIVNDPLELIKWVWAVFYYVTTKSIDHKIPIIFS